MWDEEKKGSGVVEKSEGHGVGEGQGLREPGWLEKNAEPGDIL